RWPTGAWVTSTAGWISRSTATTSPSTASAASATLPPPPTTACCTAPHARCGTSASTGSSTRTSTCSWPDATSSTSRTSSTPTCAAACSAVTSTARCGTSASAAVSDATVSDPARAPAWPGAVPVPCRERGIVMGINIDRRRLVMAGGLGAGVFFVPGGQALAAGVLGARGFTHNVASGEPDTGSMLLWTRYVPALERPEIVLEAEVALDREFGRIIAGGTARPGSYRDWTVKLTVSGLQPGTTYWYRFVAPDGSRSPVGRTRTLPAGQVERFGLAVFSCSNLPNGWFNAYAHAAQREDLDLWLHVGDYIYEYGIDSYRQADRIPDRVLMPAHEREMVSLLDYRMRLACYRADADLQRLHQHAPMVALWDDHEITNDAWEGGAQNHQPET